MPNAFRIVRKIKCLVWRVRLKNTHFSLFCNNCVGAMVLHDLNLPFRSPTVNLWIPAPDYIEFLGNLEHYLSAPIENITAPTDDHPVGLLGKRVRIEFQHYSSFEDGVECWRRRVARVRHDNIYAVLVERDGCTEDLLRRFDQLPFANKIALVHKPYPGLRCAHVVKGCIEHNQVGLLTDIKGTGSFHYDQFDWVRFFNRK